MKKHLPRIGIIGGMGPRATVQFEQLLLDRLTGSDQAIPDIVCLNYGHIPDRTKFLIGDGDNPALAIQHAINQLLLLNCDVLCMPCNTAHAPKILSQLDTAGVPLLHMPREALNELNTNGFKRCLVLSTDGTRQADVFVGKNTLRLNDREQRLVSKLIADIKTGQSCDTHDLEQIIANRGADSVLLGCTELSFMQPNLEMIGIPTIDTLAVLAGACVQYIERSQPCSQPTTSILISTP